MRDNSWGIISGAIAEFVVALCCLTVLNSMLPEIDLRNGHSVIAPKYF